MRTTRSSRSILGAAIVAIVAVLSNVAWASTEQLAYSFGGDEDGEYPSTDLVLDGAGNLYGTTVLGGDFGSGTVFELSPSADGWTHTVLYSFSSGADGGQPYGGVTLDEQGNLYGSTVTGGTAGACEGGCGVVYRLTNSGGTWTETVLHDFTGGDDGSGPGAGVTLDAKGNLYGMTPTGGSFGFGVIYQLLPSANNSWEFKVIHTFTGGKDGGSASAGRMILDAAGTLYGVATVGGQHQQGVAFRLAQGRGGAWKLTPLYAFKGQPDAGFPYGALVFDNAGNLYGTTYYDGANDLGAVYELARGVGGRWSESVLYSFRGGTDGANSISNLVFDAAGNLYGTTSEGGAVGCSCGVIFRLHPDGTGSWTEAVAHRFTNSPDGAFAYNGIVADGAGNFFGTTVYGGAAGEGTVYEFTP